MSQNASFLLPFIGHFVLVVGLYVALTIARAKAMGSGQTSLSAYVAANADLGRARAIQRNLANQFEAPLFAYFAAAVLLSTGQVAWFDIAGAWIFFAGRIVHSLVQTLTDNVALRGQVFVINFVGILLLMGHIGWLVVTGALP